MSAMIDQFIGSKLRSFREKSGCSVGEICQDLNMPPDQWESYEEGCERIPSHELVRMSEALNQPVDAFFPAEVQNTDNNKDMTELRQEALRAIHEIDSRDVLTHLLSIMKSF